MANLSALFGGGVKSVQAGTITIGNGSTSGTATITAVSTSKSVIHHNGAIGATSNQSVDTTAYCNFVDIVLTNSTTVTGTRGYGGGAITVAFTVVEYY